MLSCKHANQTGLCIAPTFFPYKSKIPSRTFLYDSFPGMVAYFMIFGDTDLTLGWVFFFFFGFMPVGFTEFERVWARLLLWFAMMSLSWFPPLRGRGVFLCDGDFTGSEYHLSRVGRCFGCFGEGRESFRGWNLIANKNTQNSQENCKICFWCGAKLTLCVVIRDVL